MLLSLDSDWTEGCDDEHNKNNNNKDVTRLRSYKPVHLLLLNAKLQTVLDLHATSVETCLGHVLQCRSDAFVDRHLCDSCAHQSRAKNGDVTNNTHKRDNIQGIAIPHANSHRLKSVR